MKFLFFEQEFVNKLNNGIFKKELCMKISTKPTIETLIFCNERKNISL